MLILFEFVQGEGLHRAKKAASRNTTTKLPLMVTRAMAPLVVVGGEVVLGGEVVPGPPAAQLDGTLAL